ncbi:MAG: hypothetical protein QF886_13060 [Planctomycetota bacterium]|nr:hypothetical protein [Planctomycetota bacterium]
MRYKGRSYSSSYSLLITHYAMTPFHAAILAVRGAGLLMRGINSFSQKSKAVQQAVNQRPQPRALPSGPDVSNAPSFAEVFQQQNGAMKSGKMANAFARRLVKQTGRPMRTERMNQFTQQAQTAFTDLANGKTNSTAIQDLKKSLKDRLGLNDDQVENVLAQMGELAKSPQAQQRFIATEGASVDFV